MEKNEYLQDESVIKEALGVIPKMEPPADFESRLFSRLNGNKTAGPHSIIGWRLVPVPAAIALLLAIAILTGNFVTVYAGKLRELGTGKEAQKLLVDTVMISGSSVVRYGDYLAKKGAGAIFSPVTLVCQMEHCRNVAEKCACCMK